MILLYVYFEEKKSETPTYLNTYIFFLRTVYKIMKLKIYLFRLEILK